MKIRASLSNPKQRLADRVVANDFFVRRIRVADGEIRDISELGFLQITKQIKPAKGSYLRFAKDVILKDYADQLRSRMFPPDTLFPKLIDSLREVFAKPDVDRVEVFFITYKLDEKGERVVEDNQHVAQIQPVGISGLSDETEETLKQQFESARPALSLLVLWSRHRVKKLGILKFWRANPEDPIPQRDYEEWEQTAIRDYMDRNEIGAGS